MPKILSVVADFNHITHPLQKPDQLRKPSLVDRILGVVCLVLTVPLTLGILTGLYFYWANRKVTLVDKSNTQKVNQVVNQVFGNVKPPESTLVENAARNLLSGKKEQAGRHLDSLANDRLLTPQVKEALLEMVVTNNQVNMLEELKNRFVDDTFPIENFPLHKARSGKMVNELVRLGVPVDIQDGDGRTALHHASSVEVAKALVKNKSAFWENKDREGLTPLNTVTSPAVLKAILSEANEIYNVPPEERQEKVNHEFSEAFKTSAYIARVDLEGQPDRRDIDNLRNNMKALLSCISRETLETDSSIAIEVIRSGSPELLKVFIDKGGAVNLPDENLLAGAMHELKFLISKNGPPDRIADVKEVVNILIDKGANVNRADIGKGDCLKFCLEIGDPALLQKLIDKHVVLTQEETERPHLFEIMGTLQDKLLHARANNSPQLEKQIDDLCACIPILLDAGVTVKKEDQFGLVVRSISMPHTVIKAFVTNGFPLSAEGEEPLLNVALRECASLRSNPKLAPDDKKKKVDNVKEIINFIIEKGAPIPPDSIFTGVETGDPDLVRLLLEKVPADGEAAFNTPLQNALFSLRTGVENKMSGEPNMDQEIEERKEIVRLLVEKGASMERDLLTYLNGLTGVDDIDQLLKDKGATK